MQRPRPKVLESHVEKIIANSLTYKGYLVLKTDAGQGSRYARQRVRSDIPAGFPDLTVLHPEKPPMLIEVKTRNGRLSRRQKQVHAHLKAQGYQVYVIFGEDEAEEFLRSLNA